MAIVNFKFELGEKVKFDIDSKTIYGVILSMIHRDDGNQYEVFIQSIKQGIFKRYYIKEEEIQERILNL